MTELWPHQQQGVKDFFAAVAAGHRRILLTSPCGGGKTRMTQEIIRTMLEAGKAVVLYSNRRMLIEQLSAVLDRAGLTHGVRAAGHDENHHRLLQVSSMATEGSRTLRKQSQSLHDADLVVIDEAHLQAGKQAMDIIHRHAWAGAAILGLTATPIGLGHAYHHLIVAGTNSELRRCGALVPALHYAPDEPDLRRLKLEPGKDLTEKQNRTVMMTQTIFGSVWEHFERLNPQRKPTILFAPDVAGSVWFAEQFSKKGVPSAHIDGKGIWWNGDWLPSNQKTREKVLHASARQDIGVLCNRFVLREGIDAPWLAHGIFATVFGSLQSYLQSGGRLLRAHPGLQAITIQDHGGNYLRHGSLNDDRLWNLAWTGAMIAAYREERLRTNRCHACQKPLQEGPLCSWCGASNTPEPYVCPQCFRVLNRRLCLCGYEIPLGSRSRRVFHTDGSLVCVEGSAFPPRRICRKVAGPKIWERFFWKARKNPAKWDPTFRQLEAAFVHDQYAWPDRSWPWMPLNEIDWFARVSEVPLDRLRRESHVGDTVR